MSIDNVLDTSRRVQYVAAAAQTAFDYPFSIFDQDDLVVEVDGVVKTVTTHYTVSGVGNDNGGTVTFVSAMAGDEIVTIYSDTEIARSTDFQQNGALASATFNDELDKLFVIAQEQRERGRRAIRLPFNAEVDTDELELDPSSWANKYMTFDADGVPTPAALSDATMTQATIGALLYPRSSAEIAAGVTPSNFKFPELHVERYGADPTGTNDCATAFNAAADVALATQRTGAEVVMGYGAYKLLSLVTVTGHILFRGQGMNSTRINLATGINGFKFVNSPATNEIEGGGIVDCSISHDASTIVIECIDVWGLRFERIFFRDGGTGSGRLIKGSGECFEMRIRDCRMLGANTYAIDLIANCNSSIIEGVDFAPNDGCTAIRIQTAGDCIIRANRFEYAGSDTGVKIEVDAAKHTVICENDITQGTSGYAIVFKNDCDGGKVLGNQFNTSGSAGCIDVQNGDYGVIANNDFWISSTSGDQIKAGGRTGWVVTGNTFRVDAALAASANLILVNTNATDWAIVGNEFVGEGSGANAGTGIQIDSGSTQIKVIGNGFNNLNTGIDTQANNASPSVVIAENSFANLTTEITVGTAMANVIKDNIGYRTQNKGTGAIANGATSATITHGLDVTPVAGDISITPTNNPTNTPGNIWVDTISSTQFNVNCENDPGASTLTFSWRADCVS